MAKGNDLRRAAGELKRSVEILEGLAGLYDTRGALEGEIATLTDQKSLLAASVGQAKAALNEEAAGYEKERAKLRDQRGKQVELHEKRIADLMNQETALQGRLEELRGQIEHAAKEGQKALDKDAAQHEVRVRSLREEATVLKAEVDRHTDVLKGYHADLTRAVSR